MAATAAVFSTKKLTTTPLATSGAPAANIGSTTPDTTTRPTKAANQGHACRAPTNSSAPNGDVIAHKQTAEELIDVTSAETVARSAGSERHFDRRARSTESDSRARMSTMSGAQVLVLHGSPGSGKTTLADAVAERLRRADVASALIDLDALSIVHPHQGRSFSRANLRAVWPNYTAVPDVRVVRDCRVIR